MGWRNASLRAMSEAPGWDVHNTRGTGVVREDPLEAGMWLPDHRCCMQMTHAGLHCAWTVAGLRV